MTTGKKVLVGCAIAIGIFFVGIAAIIVIALFATKSIADVADQQLAALRAGDYAKAYAYTSKDFQDSTPLDKFKEFVDAYPSLKNNESSSFSNRSMENDQGTLEGTLKSKDGGVTPITYHLVKENVEWRILNIQVNPAGPEVKGDGAGTDAATTPAGQTDAATTSIFDVRLSDTVGQGSYVETHKAEFSTDTPEILTSAYIRNAKQGEQVQAILIYSQTGDQVGPATNTIQEEGDIISNFSFTKPTQGWPVGNYQVAVKIATGEVKAVDFSIK